MMMIDTIHEGSHEKQALDHGELPAMQIPASRRRVSIKAILLHAKHASKCPGFLFIQLAPLPCSCTDAKTMEKKGET